MLFTQCRVRVSVSGSLTGGQRTLRPRCLFFIDGSCRLRDLHDDVSHRSLRRAEPSARGKRRAHLVEFFECHAVHSRGEKASAGQGALFIAPYAPVGTLDPFTSGWVKPATEFSGLQAQRVKLATELQRAQRGYTLYVSDEQTSGLHCRRDGLSGAGDASGTVVAAGTPAHVADKGVGASAGYLTPHCRQPPPRTHSNERAAVRSENRTAARSSRSWSQAGSLEARTSNFSIVGSLNSLPVCSPRAAATAPDR